MRVVKSSIAMGEFMESHFQSAADRPIRRNRWKLPRSRRRDNRHGFLNSLLERGMEGNEPEQRSTDFSKKARANCPLAICPSTMQVKAFVSAKAFVQSNTTTKYLSLTFTFSHCTGRTNTLAGETPARDMIGQVIDCFAGKKTKKRKGKRN